MVDIRTAFLNLLLPNVANDLAEDLPRLIASLEILDSVLNLHDLAIADKLDAEDLNKALVGLGNVDNTSDVNKPVSTQQAAAITAASEAQTLARQALADAITLALAGKAATAHTHALANLLQSGATVGQVARWTGAAWVPVGGVGAVAAADINVGLMLDLYTKTINGNTAFTFSGLANIPPVWDFNFRLSVTSGTPTWPASVIHPNGSAPTFAPGKTALINFATENSGAQWRMTAVLGF